ncbi:MAG TPA: sigma-70 family RNA polymerase sigma factor [Candidatus Polarisedimenticolia bacterium]|nr:sigma-70 family RNA polymerase sigma factor [Candidatus Polarisedimenticolia bacterium]
MDERELIRQAQGGDLPAFEQIVRRWRDQVFRIARQIVGEDEAAKDVSQLVFIRLWQVLGKYREGGSFPAYLHRITVNVAIDFSRRQSRRDSIESRDPEGVDRLPSLSLPDDQPLAPGEVQRIFGVLARKLSHRQRAAFVLREIEGMPTEEVCEILGMSQSTVRNHILEARKVLQEGLRRLFPEYARGREDKKE